MEFAILSAGEGSRLAQEGICKPKPMVEVGGIAIIERLIRIFSSCNSNIIHVIINNHQPETYKHLTNLSQEFALNIITMDTPSSMHSLHELIPHIKSEKFCLTTVDTIFKEEEFKRYIAEWKKSKADAFMGVTEFVDDEKPLYIESNNENRIVGFHDIYKPGYRYVSGGIYGLSNKTFATLNDCVEKGLSRMRTFQRKLIENNLHVEAFPFEKIIDIDHAEDIVKANYFIA